MKTINGHNFFKTLIKVCELVAIFLLGGCYGLALKILWGF